MTSDDELRALVAADAAEALAEARAVARARAVERLADTLTEAIVEAALAAGNVGVPRDAAGESTEPAPGGDGDGDGDGDGEPMAPDLSLYLYGVVGADDVACLPDGLVALGEGPVAAVAAPVEAAEFAEDALRHNLGDMAWVERTARVHEEVLDTLLRTATVIPMRMCTVYASEDGVREMLRREREPLAAALEELAGKTEWGVKMFAGGPPGNGAPAPQPASGTAYLEERLHERDRAEEHARAVDLAAAEIHQRLADAAADALVLPSGRSNDGDGELALNGVYLIEDAAQEAFADVVRHAGADHESLGLTLRLTGPWPAYNFVRGTLGVAW